MSGAPPPGYTSQSMLGGNDNVPIVPIMGGGGIIDQSFSLMGGDGIDYTANPIMPIPVDTPMQGGQVATVVEEDDDSRLEYYTFEYSGDEIQRNNVLAQLKNKAADTFTKIGSVSVYTEYTAKEKESSFKKTIPAETKAIVLIPPINGKIEGFTAALKMLERFKFAYIDLSGAVTIKANIVVVFANGFFGTDTTFNQILFLMYLLVRNANEGRIHIIGDRWSKMHEREQLTKNLELANADAERLKVDVFTNATKGDDLQAAEARLNAVTADIHRIDAEIAAILDYEPFKLEYDKDDKGIRFLKGADFADADPGATKFITFKYGNELSYTPLKRIPTSSCEDLRSVIKLDGLYKGLSGTVEGAVEPAATPAAPAAAEPTTDLLGALEGKTEASATGPTEDKTIYTIDANTLLVFRLGPAKPYRPSCQPQIKDPKKFNIVYSDYITNTRTLQGNLDYGIRVIPSRFTFDKDGHKTNLHDSVYKDWLEGNFSEAEVRYLYSLNLSPQILEKMYEIENGKRGQVLTDKKKYMVEEIAEFLYLSGKSSCFKQELLMTRPECDKVKVFINLLQEALTLHPDVAEAGVKASKDTSYEDTYGPVGLSDGADLIDGDEGDLGTAPRPGVGNKAGYYYKTVTVERVGTERTMIKTIKFKTDLRTDAEIQGAFDNILAEFNEHYKGVWKFIGDLK